MTTENTLSRELMKEMSIESLLGVTAGDIEQLKELAASRAFMGQFGIIKLSLQPSEGDNKGHVAMQYKVNAVLGLEETNPYNLPEPEEGSVYTERFYPGYGIQRLARIMEQCAEPGTSIQAFIEAGEGSEFTAMVKCRARKDQDTKEVKYFNEVDVFSMIGAFTPQEAE